MDENNTSSLMKLTLYDRIFKPQTVTLSNGHSVQRAADCSVSGCDHLAVAKNDGL